MGLKDINILYIVCCFEYRSVTRRHGADLPADSDRDPRVCTQKRYQITTDLPRRRRDALTQSVPDYKRAVRGLQVKRATRRIVYKMKMVQNGKMGGGVSADVQTTLGARVSTPAALYCTE